MRDTLAVVSAVDIHLAAAIGTVEQACEGSSFAPSIGVSSDLASDFLCKVESLLADNGFVGILENRPFNLVSSVNVWENIVLPLGLDGRKVDEAYVNDIIATLGIENRIYNLPNQLSGGQQQRVAIARALVNRPEIIFADEPTGNLDSKTSDEVIALLKMTAKKYGQTIVMITHDDEIAQVADRILVIEDGQVVDFN